MTIRPWSSDDSYEELTLLLHNAYAELAALGMKFTAVDQSVDTTRRRVDSGRTYIAVKDGRLMGTITLYTNADKFDPSYYFKPGIAHFGQFAVSAEARGLGAGRMLHETAVTEAANLGFSELALDTAETADHLIKLYTKWGYEIVDRHVWGGRINYSSVIMSRRL